MQSNINTVYEKNIFVLKRGKLIIHIMKIGMRRKDVTMYQNLKMKTTINIYVWDAIYTISENNEVE